MAYQDIAKEFMGVGWSFPLEVDPATGRMRSVSYEEDIAQAIGIILRTGVGERVMQPKFGSTLPRFVFDSPNYTARMQLQQEVLQALTHWEPRIDKVDVAVTDGEEGCLLLHIAYEVRATNNPYNLVYPYYIDEGLEV